MGPFFLGGTDRDPRAGIDRASIVSVIYGLGCGGSTLLKLDESDGHYLVEDLAPVQEDEPDVLSGYLSATWIAKRDNRSAANNHWRHRGR